MKKPYARSLSEDSLNLLRQQAHRLCGDGRTWADIARRIGKHLTMVMKWSRRFDLGVDAVKELRSQRWGRRFGEKWTINLVDETLLRGEIIGTHPQKVALPFALWNRKAVQEAIKLCLNVDIPIRAVSEYLRRWSFTPQRPVKLAVEQRPELLQTWLKDTYARCS